MFFFHTNTENTNNIACLCLCFCANACGMCFVCARNLCVRVVMSTLSQVSILRKGKLRKVARGDSTHYCRAVRFRFLSFPPFLPPSSPFRSPFFDPLSTFHLFNQFSPTPPPLPSPFPFLEPKIPSGWDLAGLLSPFPTSKTNHASRIPDGWGWSFPTNHPIPIVNS